MTNKVLEYVQQQKDTTFFLALNFYSPPVPIEAKESTRHVCRLRMDQVGVKIANTNMVIAELQRDWTLPTAPGTGELYQKRLPNFGYIYQHMEFVQAKVLG